MDGHGASLAATVGIQSSEETREFKSLNIKTSTTAAQVVADQLGCLDSTSHVLTSVLGVHKLLANIQDRSRGPSRSLQSLTGAPQAMKQDFKLIPVLLCSKKSDEARYIFEAQAEVVNVRLLEGSEDFRHDLTRGLEHGISDLLILGIGWVRYINACQVLSKLVSILNTVLAMVQLLGLGKVENTVTKLLCTVPVLGLQKFLDSSTTSLHSEKSKVNLSSTTILAELVKDSKIEQTNMLVSYILKVGCILGLEELEESLVKNKEKLRALVLNPEASELSTTFKNDFKLSLNLDDARVLLVKNRLVDYGGHNLRVGRCAVMGAKTLLKSAEEDKDKLAQMDVELDGEVVARDRSSENNQIEAMVMATLNRVVLDHLEVVLLRVAAVIQHNNVLKLLESVLMPASKSKLEMLIGLNTNLDGSVHGNMGMTFLLTARRNDCNVQLGKALLDCVDSSLYDNGHRLVDMLLMLLAHLSERNQGQDVSIGLPTTGFLNDLLVLDGDLVENRELNLDVNLKDVGVLLVDLTDDLLGPLVLSTMVTDSLPNEGTELSEFHPHTAAVVVATEEKGSFEGIVMAMLDTLVQDGDDLKIVLVHIFVTNQLAVMGQLVKSPDGQAMRVSKGLLVSLKDLDVDLNHLLVTMMFLIELNENGDRATQELVLKVTRGKTGAVDAKVDELSLLEVALVMVTSCKTSSHVDTLSN
ncbi:hypothetical protein HG531_009027 [Fusarium graminearum]|nr:hypothetical protein HG531_009027 [Fusarium graminearum]